MEARVEETESYQNSDHYRIARMMGVLHAYWLRHPYLRLGQIVANMAGDDPYSVPDEVMEAELRDALTNGSIVRKRPEPCCCPPPDPAPYQCEEQESGGIRCELPADHDGDRACPEAIASRYPQS